MSVSNLSEVKQMYEAQNMMKGVRPQAFIAKAEAEAKKIDEDNALIEDENTPKKATRVILIPDELFSDFA